MSTKGHVKRLRRYRASNLTFRRSSSPRSTVGNVSGRSSAIRPGPNGERRGPVQPHGGARRLEGRHALGEQPEHHAGKHVAGARGRELRAGRGVDRGDTVGRGDDGIGALQHDDRARAGGRHTRPLEFGYAVHIGEQARKLAVMRREHDRRGARGDGGKERSRIVGERRSARRRRGRSRPSERSAAEHQFLGALADAQRRDRSGRRSCADRREGLSGRGHRRPRAP